MEKFEITVIGGGPGGYVAAIHAAQLGKKVALIEAREVGGTCLNRGCIPTKAYLHSAEVYKAVKEAEAFGIHTENTSFDFKAIHERKNKIVSTLTGGVGNLLKANGVKVYNGLASFRDRYIVDIAMKDGSKDAIESDKYIIATGSVPAVPPIPGIKNALVVTSDEALDFEEVPESIVIVGGGVIGVEIASYLREFGSKVTIVEMLDKILPPVDDEASTLLRGLMESRGIDIKTSAKITEITETGVKYEKDGKVEELTAAKVLVAIGRRPNSKDLKPENAGILTERGFVPVDGRLQTNIEGIYAIGDVTPVATLAHTASAQGMVAAENAAGSVKVMDYTVVPACIYTTPEIACVGLTEKQAIETGKKLKIGRFNPAGNGKSLVMGETDGLIKIITDADNGEILGATLMCARATDMISELGLAIKLESDIEEVADLIHPHPTVSEVIMEAAHDVHGMCVHNRPKKK